MVTKFLIKNNEFLSRGPVEAWYSTPYRGFKEPGNPDYLNVLKNPYLNTLNEDDPADKLSHAVATLRQVLQSDLPVIQRAIGSQLSVACVPRSKANMHESQLLFSRTVSDVVTNTAELFDSKSAITRIGDTRMTHIPIETSAAWNHGKAPYPGITRDTCEIDSHVHGRILLLIDDIYTPGVNIDEDAIQALYDEGAHTVFFYSVAKTGG
jgi:hypothetical protein